MVTAVQTPTLTQFGPVEAAPFQCVGCGGHRSTWRPAMRADPEQRPFDLLRCGRCGLVQQHPRDASGRLTAQYDPSYYVFNEAEPLRWARAVQQYVVHALPWETRRGRRLLDVGCALGHFAALARRRGWRVTGLDVSPEAASHASVDFGLDVRAGTLAQHASTLPPFDLVFLGDVIEHVADPAALLSEVRSLLAPDGIACIDTPNWNSRWRKIGRSHWLGLNRYHINLFDPHTLTTMLETCGFTDVQVGSYTHYRYDTWTRRPEVQGWIQRLPEFMAWRINRTLGSLDRFGRWGDLRVAGPRSLEKANRYVIDLAHRQPPQKPKQTADNLTATARRA